jgi:AcrR family transcriptional regulator
MSEQRRRREAESRRRVVEVALELMGERGFAAVTMEEIADAAAISRRTLYRRFRTKEDVVSEVPRRWFAVWDDTAAALSDADPLEVAETTCRAVAAHIDANRIEVMTAYAALRTSPALTAQAATERGWLERVIGVLERADEDLPPHLLHVVAGAYLGAIDGLLSSWFDDGGTWSLEAAMGDLLARIRPIFPQTDGPDVS